MLSVESAACRYWAAVAAQIAGINLFIAIGFLAFPSSKTELAFGLKCIVVGMLIVFTLSLATFIPPFLRAWRGKLAEFDHKDVDRMIFLLFLIDMGMHTFLVCQEGGLDRSMFLPVFFLIPIAYTLVERRVNLRRLFWLYLLTALSILLSYSVALFVTKQGATTIPIVGIPITDFPGVAPVNYNNALFIVCLVTLAIPMLQIKIIEYSRRKEVC
jgi:hypothetical protein